jgi:hypothetical protein
VRATQIWVGFAARKIIGGTPHMATGIVKAVNVSTV